MAMVVISTVRLEDAIKKNNERKKQRRTPHAACST